MNKKKIGLHFLVPLMLFSLVLPQAALAARPARFESSKTPDVNKSAISTPIAPSASFRVSAAPLLLQSQAVPSLSSVPVLGPNLINNPGLEIAGTSGRPAGWLKGGYGANDRLLTYPVAGNASSSGIRASISSYTDGDVKWYFNDVPITAGQTYQFSDYSSSTATSTVTVRYLMSDGNYLYKFLGDVSESSSFQQNVFNFTPPTGATSLTIFHALKRPGILTTDDYSLNTATVPPTDTGSSTDNLLPNSDLEIVKPITGLPANWWSGGWGTNVAVFNYPVTGVNGSRAARVDISNYESGDAKWRSDAIPVSPGIYTYSDDYKSDKTTIITIQYQRTDGSYFYKDIVKVPVSTSTWNTITADLSVPAGVSTITVFHLLNQNGFLTIDNTSLKARQTGGTFSTGAVTMRFDDGWLSQYQTALPILDKAGIKGTFYIVSKQLSDDGYPAFISRSQVKALYDDGQEIGAHTRTHPYLTQLQATDLQNEIQGSRQDLQAMNVGPINSLAYPYGDYDSTTTQAVKNAGFLSAACSNDGDVTPSSDRYQLERQPMESSITIDQAKLWIDNALANKEWLILSFHKIDNSGERYSVTPVFFQQVVDYLKQKNAPVVTVSQGAQSLK